MFFLACGLAVNLYVQHSQLQCLEHDMLDCRRGRHNGSYQLWSSYSCDRASDLDTDYLVLLAGVMKMHLDCGSN